MELTTRSGLVGLLRAIRNDARGAAAIEFGICVTALVALLLACVQVALLFFAQQGIQTSSETVARKVLTGSIATTTTQAQFRQIACQALPSYMTCSKLLVDIKKATSFAAAQTGTVVLTYDSHGNITNSWNYDMGGAGDIVVLRLMYPWRTPIGPLGFRLSNQASNGMRLVTGTMVFKAEPYTS